ncbi:MAG: P27 family phage terminase small subunit [Terriglobales bacterium]
MGRSEKHPALHQLQGTQSVAQAAGFLVPAGRPKFPKNISNEAKVKFKRLCAVLEERRALTAGDGELLCIYARLHTRWEKALEKIATQGEICAYTRLDSNGAPHEVEKKNLWLTVAETCEKNMVGCLDRLGLTPLNHAKVKTVRVDEQPPAPGAPKTDQQRWDEFMNPAPKHPTQHSDVLAAEMNECLTEEIQ